MKKFSKILVLILTLAAIVAAFTVVALADGAADPNVVRDPGGFSNFTFEGGTVGSTWGTGSGNTGYGGGVQIAEAYPGGNKYLRLTYSSKNPDTGKNYSYTRYTDVGGGNTSHRNAYTFNNYPTVAIDFDIMSENGKWGGTTNSTNNDASLLIRHWDTSLGKDGKSGSALISSVPFSQLGLSKTPYTWQHITVVYEYSTETVDDVTTEYLTMKLYINGELAKTYADKTVVAGASNFYVGSLYINTSRYTQGDIIGLDNINFTYFKKDYDTSKVPTFIYNESYEAPFGKVVATVTSGEETTYYDSFDEAYAYAATKTEATTIQLYANTTASIVVDSDNITIDARKRDAEGNLTAESYTFSYSETTTKGYYLNQIESGLYKAEKIVADFMVTTAAGVTTYHMADEFDAKFKALTGSATLKLLNNIETTAFVTTSGSARAFTLDLNGYELKRIEYYGNVYEATGDEEYPAEPNGTATSSSGSILFFTPSSGGKVATLTITSTAEAKGKIYNVVAKTNTYIRDGVVERREILQYDETGIVTTQTTGSSYTFSNVDVYATVFAYTDYANRNVTYKLDNVNFYQMSPPPASNIIGNASFLFYFGGQYGMTLHATDCMFYMNAAVPTNYLPAGKSGSTGLIRFTQALSSGYTTDVKFTNCDIIGADGKFPVATMNSQQKENIVFDGCRFHNMQNATAGSTVSINGSIGTSGTYPGAASGFSKLTLTNPITVAYDIPAVDMWTATNEAIQSVDFSFGTKQQVCTFTTVTTKELTVTVNGNPMTLTPGISDLYSDKALRVYADTTSNDFLNKIYLFCDADGNVYKSILGITDKGVQLADWDNAVLTFSDQTGYVGGIKNTNFNLSFLSGFRYNLYLPIDERLTDIVVEGFEKDENAVTINDGRYWVFSSLVGTAEAADANVIYATYKVDGVAYSQSWSINAVQYAQMLIAYPEYETEKAAIGSMLKFIKEAVLYLNSAADVTDINSIIESSGVALTYGTYTSGNSNPLEAYEGNITGVNFLIHNGIASYKFSTAAENTEVSFKIRNDNVGFTRNGTDVVLDAMRVYDLIVPITVTAGGKTATFSMLDYLTAMEGAEGIELAKALYEFGVAAEDYRRELSGYKSTFDYSVRGITDGDHIVAAAESSRKIKVVDLGSTIDPDTLKNLTLTNVKKVVFIVDGKTVATVTEAPFEYNLTFNKYGKHTLTIEVYDENGFISQREIGYTVLDDEFDDTYLSFEENFDGDTDGSGLHGGSCSGTQSIVDNAFTVSSDGRLPFMAHPLATSLPKNNEVYYIDFDIKTSSVDSSTSFVIRDGYQNGTSVSIFTLKKSTGFTANKFYNFKIILDFYTNYATVFVDGEYYQRVSMAANTNASFAPQFLGNTTTITIDNYKFSSYGYLVDLPEPTYSEDKPVVIFRFDDFGSNSTIGEFKKLAYLLEKYGATGSYGLVGEWFESNTDANKGKIVSLTEGFIEQGIEIFHHGYLHSTKEYNNNGGDPYDTQKENFGKTMDIAEQYFGVIIHSFGSPYNHAGDTAVRMIQENYPEITSFMNLYYATDGVATIPVFNNNCYIEESTGVIDALAFITNFESKRGDDYLISLSHPGYWDDSELAQFELILRYLNASGVTYMTATEAAEDYTESFVENKEYTVQGINEGDRIVSAYEPTRRVRVIDPKSYSATPVANKTAGVSYVSSVEFYVDGTLLYTATAAPFEYMLPVGSVGTHTLKVVVNMTVGATKTYERTYKVLEATANDALTLEEDFSTSTDASAINGGVCTAELTQTVTDGVLKLAAGKSQYMNLYPDYEALSVVDRVYFMELDFALDSNAYQMAINVCRIASNNGSDTREFLTASKNYDYVQNSSKTWYNVKIMFDPGNDSAIVYVDGYEYRRVNLEYLTNYFFRPILNVNQKNVYLDNYKFYAYDLAEKEEVKAPTVILRFDDLKDSSLEEIERATAILNNYGIDSSIGVIGSALGSAELYQAIIDLYNNGAEFWHHGYTHNTNEFSGASAESAVESYRKTFDLIKENCGFEITSLGGPYNNVDSTALKAIQEAFPSLKCVMDSEDKSNIATVVNFRAITTFEGDTGTSAKINLEKFIEHFEKIQHNDYIVIYCHPGSWTNADFTTFDQLVQYLISEGVTFMTPSEAADDYIANN